MQILSLKIAPRFNSKPPNVVKFALRIIGFHEWTAWTFAVLAVICVVADVNLEVLEPLKIGRLAAIEATKHILNNESCMDEQRLTQVQSERHFVCETAQLGAGSLVAGLECRSISIPVYQRP